MIFGGNVGINTSTPDRLFKVNGNSNVTGDAYAATRSGGAIDVAEWIKSDSGLQAGDVVVVDRFTPNRVKKSTLARDSAVAGVVSTRPHLLMGSEYQGPDAIPLAFTGRVPVKVTAEAVPIVPVYWLTTSSTSGHALKFPSDCSGARVVKPWNRLNDPERLWPLWRWVNEYVDLASRLFCFWLANFCRLRRGLIRLRSYGDDAVPTSVPQFSGGGSSAASPTPTVLATAHASPTPVPTDHPDGDGVEDDGSDDENNAGADGRAVDEKVDVKDVKSPSGGPRDAGDVSGENTEPRVATPEEKKVQDASVFVPRTYGAVERHGQDRGDQTVVAFPAKKTLDLFGFKLDVDVEIQVNVEKKTTEVVPTRLGLLAC